MSAFAPAVRVVPERVSALGVVWICWTVECGQKRDPFVTDFEWSERSRAIDFAAGYRAAFEDLRLGRFSAGSYGRAA